MKDRYAKKLLSVRRIGIYSCTCCLGGSQDNFDTFLDKNWPSHHFDLPFSIVITMSSIFYVTIEHSNHSSPCFRHCSSVSMEPASYEPAVEALRRYCPAQTLATCWELLFALFSAVILSAYTLHHEARVRTSFPAPFACLTDPSRATITRSLNCRFRPSTQDTSVSFSTHRRH